MTRKMGIEEFVELSEGQWSSMRSIHSHAFKHFELSISLIKIQRLHPEDFQVKSLISKNLHQNKKASSAFKTRLVKINSFALRSPTKRGKK